MSETPMTKIRWTVSHIFHRTSHERDKETMSETRGEWAKLEPLIRRLKNTIGFYLQAFTLKQKIDKAFTALQAIQWTLKNTTKAAGKFLRWNQRWWICLVWHNRAADRKSTLARPDNNEARKAHAPPMTSARNIRSSRDSWVQIRAEKHRRRKTFTKPTAATGIEEWALAREGWHRADEDWSTPAKKQQSSHEIQPAHSSELQRSNKAVTGSDQLAAQNQRRENALHQRGQSMEKNPSSNRRMSGRPRLKIALEWEKRPKTRKQMETPSWKWRWQQNSTRNNLCTETDRGTNSTMTGRQLETGNEKPRRAPQICEQHKIKRKMNSTHEMQKLDYSHWKSTDPRRSLWHP
jgi:hypothetical protein